MASLSERIKLGAAAIMALLAYGLSIYAQSNVATKARTGISEAVTKIESGCGPDIKKFCGGITPGQGRLFYCIMANQDKISTKCDYVLFDASRNLKGVLNKIEDVANACWNDVEKSCSSIPEGGGVIQCLMENETRLSKQCQAAIIVTWDSK